ncbi:g_PROTEIN_RECEP_F2_4 domain-containing protein [Caerostris extrusa]|uniref:G_PROTEIN_RECEP_F2_4 domain-containing protein n=1 Tax=Caerostris extrusa TaxID=172846 RepID=A0AAV4P0N4_CAEEX|nr:g_PROTEIN_RECEP_F2_4 domain-containing protein [Caerostris extrusa]
MENAFLIKKYDERKKGDNTSEGVYDEEEWNGNIEWKKKSPATKMKGITEGLREENPEASPAGPSKPFNCTATQLDITHRIILTCLDGFILQAYGMVMQRCSHFANVLLFVKYQLDVCRRPATAQQSHSAHFQERRPLLNCTTVSHGCLIVLEENKSSVLDNLLTTFFSIPTVFPALCIGLWCLLMTYHHNTHCWSGYGGQQYIWLITGPMIAALLLEDYYLKHDVLHVNSECNRPFQIMMRRSEVPNCAMLLPGIGNSKCIVRELFPLGARRHRICCKTLDAAIAVINPNLPWQNRSA